MKTELDSQAVEQAAETLFWREYAVQIVAFLPWWRRIVVLMRNPGWVLQYLFRLRDVGPHLPALLESETGRTRLELILAEQPELSESQLVKHCVELEQLAATYGCRERLVAMRNHLLQYSILAQWDEFNSQRVISQGWWTVTLAAFSNLRYAGRLVVSGTSQT